MTSRTACAPWKGILPNAVTCLLSSSSTRAYHSDTGISNREGSKKSVLQHVWNRKWLLDSPNTKIHEIIVTHDKAVFKESSLNMHSFSLNCQPTLGEGTGTAKSGTKSFYIIRDDLLNPLINGNKARKLDAVLPLLEAHLVTDMVTCGGCQSAHTAALAVGCAERGIKAHLLLRGERPEIPTGYNLISEMFGNVVYVPRSAYANREAILEKHASFVAGVEGTIHELYDLMDFLPVNSTHCHNDRQSTRKVAIVKEGAGDTIALLGLIRLVNFLAQPSLFGNKNALQIIVDSGTGTTAIGIALGVYLLGLPWKVTGVMLAGSAEGYRRQESQLLSEFKKLFVNHKCEFHMDSTGLVEWTDRLLPRKFGNVLEGELELCKRISQQSGILLDPVYTLASWEHAVRACQSTLDTNSFVVMLHTGGTLGIFGLAQRYKSYFQKMK